MGLPALAAPSRCCPYPPDNGMACRNWLIRMMSDPVMHRSFSDFYADRNGIRRATWRWLAARPPAFATAPGVIGYDLLNEPWGDELSEIAPSTATRPA